jgi:hypothetical protein
VRVSHCVDCGTPIIGERLRCPRHQDCHARELAMRSVLVRSRDAIQMVLAVIVVVELALAIGLVAYALRGGI